ncbi:MAG: preprotein translocase subunit YajC [Trichococcus flocculiformis]|jgi:preprotein translocase subunit YajC|uniref:Preprotein translocase subunit YajC n=2 Tax=Trichococcus flocculiformis TaxID=82803 RepID=A0AB38BE04_9LACT|nr:MULTISPECIES: preprotein translocase subunit YajC [Trichococcus]CZQ86861.1 preprotein translocase yajc [Trichococcus flocculiformis]CZQ91963.1 preprotein translocase yajc [Trichococcus sp. ES5]SFH46626.1 preprotein translocase subunit YajC [Trichococcus flocculiformis]SHF43938.1 preprotein translocase subunit YajC [Trichococcus flocculiformis]HRG29857.1 preprotein translocase subunit YajC [Trichococcus flocculiformis]
MDTVIMIAFYGVLFGVMYFILIRPQKKQAQKTQDMLSQIKPGDKVVTIGGLHGIVEEINSADNTVVLDCEGIFLTFEKRAISRISKVATITTDDAIVEDFTATETEQTQEDNNEE